MFGAEVSSAVGQSGGGMMEVLGGNSVGLREEQRKEGFGLV